MLNEQHRHVSAAPRARASRAYGWCARSFRLAFLGILAYPLLMSSASAAIPQAEHDALVNLYNAAGGTQWTNNSGWNGAAGSECAWAGVACDAGQTTVIGLAFANNHLAGTLAPLAAMSNLVYVDVSQNALTGALPSLSGLTKLQVFNAYSNQFSGGVPDLSSQTALTQFRVWGNKLSGSLPSLAAPTNLVLFDASNNLITGTIPPISQVSVLEQFNVGSNQLSGSIPSLSGLAQLKKLDVSYNDLTGGVPDFSGNTSLQTLYIDHNNLSGALPPAPPSLAIATVCPNAQLAQVADATWDVLTGQSPWYASCGAASMLVIADVNSGFSPSVGSSFSVTVGLRDSTGAPAVATGSFSVNLSVVHGSGQLPGSPYCYINLGETSCTIPGVVYTVAESDVEIEAATNYYYGNQTKLAPALRTFDVLAGTYSVGGTVSGLAGPGLVLQLQPTEQTITVNSNGPFQFPGTLGNGAYYDVSVVTSPSYPAESCSVSSAYGNILGSSISSAQVVCTRLYSVILQTSQHGTAQVYGSAYGASVYAGSSASIYISPDFGYRASVAAQGCTLNYSYSNEYTTSPLNSDCVVSVTFVALDYIPSSGPVRVLDTLVGGSTVDGQHAATGPLSGNATLALPVLGRGGIPSSGVGALVLNVMATNTPAAGYATVWPSCATRPNASNLNFAATHTVANLVIVPVGCDATINLVASKGPTDMVVDVVGYFRGSSLTSLSPSRLLDTRGGSTTIDGQSQGGGPGGGAFSNRPRYSGPRRHSSEREWRCAEYHCHRSHGCRIRHRLADRSDAPACFEPQCDRGSDDSQYGDRQAQRRRLYFIVQLCWKHRLDCRCGRLVPCVI